MRTLMVAACALALTACASVPGKYSAPSETSDHALIKVGNHLNGDAGKTGDANAQTQGGLQMPGMDMGGSFKAMLFQVDGDKITKVGGVQEVRVKPGPHQVQVMVDDGLIPLSGDVNGMFVKDHVYDVNIYHDEQSSTRYRADLVDESSADKVMNQARF